MAKEMWKGSIDVGQHKSGQNRLMHNPWSEDVYRTKICDLFFTEVDDPGDRMPIRSLLLVK
jgi:hypothetical protein